MRATKNEQIYTENRVDLGEERESVFFLYWSLLNELFFKSLKSTGFTGSRGAKSRVDLVEDRESVYIRSRGAKNRVDLVEDREIVYIRTITLKLIANPVFRTTFRGNCHTLE